MRARFLALLFIVTLAAPAAAQAVQPADLCGKAAAQAEKNHAIPAGLLQAISLVETGHSREGDHAAWPWTVNVNGRGHYFKTRREAGRFVKNRARLGETSMDIGCFQINTKWHGPGFTSTNAMFDPEAGANYAAGFLKKLHEEFGDWNIAVKNYHSRTETKGDYYGKKVAAALAGLSEETESKEDVIINIAPVSLLAAKPGGVELTVFTAKGPMFETKGASPIIGKRAPLWN